MRVFTDTVVYPSQFYSGLEPQYPLNTYNMVTTDDTNGRLGWVGYYSGETDYDTGSFCWHQIFGDNEFVTNYIEGCGETSYDASEFPATDRWNMVYYKKGNDTWGEPLTLSNLSKSSDNTLQLYPNPLKQGEQLQLNSGDFNPSQLTVYNSIGNKMYETYNLTSGVQALNLSSLPQGMYIMQFVNAKNEFTTSKLIIK